MTDSEMLLNKFMEEQEKRLLMGSGDDMYYVQKLRDYINSQRKLWIEFIDFVKKEG